MASLALEMKNKENQMINKLAVTKKHEDFEPVCIYIYLFVLLTNGGKYITRFGKKGGAYDLLHQTSGAYNQDMGVVSEFEPIDPYSNLREDPEVSTKTVNDVVGYLKMLKAPLPSNLETPPLLHLTLHSTLAASQTVSEASGEKLLVLIFAACPLVLDSTNSTSSLQNFIPGGTSGTQTPGVT